MKATKANKKKAVRQKKNSRYRSAAGVATAQVRRNEIVSVSSVAAREREREREREHPPAVMSRGVARRIRRRCVISLVVIYFHGSVRKKNKN